MLNYYWLQKLLELRPSKKIGSNEPWDLGDLWQPGPPGKFHYEALSMKYFLVIFHDSTQYYTNLLQHAERLKYYDRVHQTFRNFGSIGLSQTLFL